MNGLSPWALSAISELEHAEEIHTCEINGIVLQVRITSDSVWASVSAGAKAINFRPCFVPSGKILGFESKEIANGISLAVDTLLGQFDVSITFSSEKLHLLGYKCTLSPSAELLIPYWPRDILLQNILNEAVNDFGAVHCSQRQTRSGLIYFSKPSSNLRVIYFQNLTSLSSYCEQTGTSLSGVVGGDLPEVGLSLPISIIKPLAAKIPVILSDAHICINKVLNKDSDQAVDYLDMLAAIYQSLPKIATKYHPWQDITKKGLADLIYNPGCWSRVNGNSYLNAYLSDYETPSEIMVQLAVLLPLLDYTEWSGENLEIINTIGKGLPSFYDKKLKSLVRWHPDEEAKLKGDEEQKKPMVMDSWYLHHPLLNLSRLALKGDKDAEKLFLNSLGFAIKVAHKFKYEWPVFYKMDTLEIIKAETEPGKGGEQDVAGMYAHVMLQAHELTNENKYLQEAIKAANKLSKVGYDIMYQANNTAFAAGAMIRLYKITGEILYLNLSYRCFASIFQNVQLWDCNYGYGKNLPTFFALFPLVDAPYTAAYEEQEVFCAFHDYLRHAEQVEILLSVKLLCAEFIRNFINRAPYYYPPMIPQEILSKEVKTGFVEKDLWIALEDIHDGIEQSGSVGQEVYGAGNAFDVLPRHFIKVKNDAFMIYIDGPFIKKEETKTTINVQMLAHEDILYSIRIIHKTQTASNRKFNFKLQIGKEKPQDLKNKNGITESVVAGNQNIHLSWADL